MTYRDDQQWPLGCAAERFDVQGDGVSTIRSQITMVLGARSGTADHVRTLTMGHKYGNFDVEDDK